MPHSGATLLSCGVTWFSVRWGGWLTAWLKRPACSGSCSPPRARASVSAPPGRFWHGWWWLYTRLVLPLAGLVTGGRSWYRVGRFLGPNISSHYRRFPLTWTVDAWRQAGFDDIQVRLMSLGGGLVMSGTRRRD